MLQGRSWSSGGFGGSDKYPGIPRVPAYGPNYLVCMLSHFSHVQLFATLWTVACQAPLSMGFSWQEYQSGLTCPPPGDLPDPGIKPMSPALQVNLLLSHRQAPRLSWLLPILWARFSSLPGESMNFQYPIVHFVFCLISCSLKPWTLMVTPSKLKRRRQWHPTPVLLPGKSHGQNSLVVYSPWGCKELDMTEVT